MDKNICFLFDMDGVMIDTESQYMIFWEETGRKYNIDIPDFGKLVTGIPTKAIFEDYLSHLLKDELNNIINLHDTFEENMSFPEISGSVSFVYKLKSESFKVGLVTSSSDTKLVEVNKEKHFDKLFDTIVSASRVTKGKPDPECYLLAAKDLNVKPEDCIVFEDSFAGIEAATKAGMKVIGLSTTHSEEELKDRCYMVIPDFKNIELSDILN